MQCNYNAKLIPSKFFQEKYNRKLSGVKLRGPRSATRPHSLEVFPITVEWPAFLMEQEFMGHCLDSSAQVPQFGARKNECEETCVLVNNCCSAWSPEKQHCSSVRTGQEAATHTRREKTGHVKDKGRGPPLLLSTDSG